MIINFGLEVATNLSNEIHCVYYNISIPHALGDKNEKILDLFWKLNFKKNLLLKEENDSIDLLEILDDF